MSRLVSEGLNHSKATSGRFTPGSGAVPPYLAGRSHEQALLGEQHDLVAGGENPPADVLLIGPRGNGKTALLRWFSNAVKARGDADAVWLTPTEAPTVGELGKMFGLDHRPSEVRFAAGLGPLTGEWTVGGRTYTSLAALLIARCRRKPLIVLLDEAHTLDPAVGQALLNASQKVRGEAPFLLCLAGTPGLMAYLGRIQTTFAERSEKLRIRLLDRASTEEALVEPLKAGGFAIERDALDMVIMETQGYPYFIQVWGNALASAAAGAPCITQDTVDAARPAFAAVRNEFYGGRWSELERSRLMRAAVTVAMAFERQGTPVLGRRTLRDALSAAGVAPEASGDLEDGGYIWVSHDPANEAAWGTDNLWEPGIPSLMAYVLRQRDLEMEESGV